MVNFRYFRSLWSFSLSFLSQAPPFNKFLKNRIYFVFVSQVFFSLYDVSQLAGELKLRKNRQALVVLVFSLKLLRSSRHAYFKF